MKRSILLSIVAVMPGAGLLAVILASTAPDMRADDKPPAPTFRSTWVAEGGDIEASGYVPGKLGERRFDEVLWTYETKDVESPVNFAVSDGKACFLADLIYKSSGTPRQVVYCLDIATGTTLWTFGETGIAWRIIGIHGDCVYVVMGKEKHEVNNSEWVISLDLRTGKKKWKSDVDIVLHDVLLSEKGIVITHANIRQLDFEKGEITWQSEREVAQNAVSSLITKTHACAIEFMFDMSGGGSKAKRRFSMIELDTGKVAKTFDFERDNREITGLWSSGEGYAYGSAQKEFLCMNLAEPKTEAKLKGDFQYRPAVTSDAIYVVDKGALRSLKPKTLEQISELKKSTGEAQNNCLGQPVVTDDVVCMGMFDSTLVVSRKDFSTIQEVSGAHPAVVGDHIFTWAPSGKGWTLQCHPLLKK